MKIIPYFVYGTAWKEERTKELTYQALKQGFRAIDTANQRKHYFEQAVGFGILQFMTDTQIERSALWIQSKFTHQAGQDHRLPYNASDTMQEQVYSSIESSFQHLHTDYLDSYVLHGPSVAQGLADQDWQAWQAMERLYAEKKVYALGISNVSAEQLQTLLDHCTIKPKYVQNRCFAHLIWDHEVRSLCQSHGMIYQGFSLLTANRAVWESKYVEQLAQKYRCTTAQVLFSFALDLEILPLTGTSHTVHMQQDLQSTKAMLSEQEVYNLEHIYQIQKR